MTIESALYRWQVVCRSWDEFSTGHIPELNAFLAGWFMYEIGAKMPDDVGVRRESFRAGWRESEISKSITSNER